MNLGIRFVLRHPRNYKMSSCSLLSLFSFGLGWKRTLDFMFCVWAGLTKGRRVAYKWIISRSRPLTLTRTRPSIPNSSFTPNPANLDQRIRLAIGSFDPSTPKLFAWRKFIDCSAEEIRKGRTIEIIALLFQLHWLKESFARHRTTLEACWIVFRFITFLFDESAWFLTEKP